MHKWKLVHETDVPGYFTDRYYGCQNCKYEKVASFDGIKWFKTYRKKRVKND